MDTVRFIGIFRIIIVLSSIVFLAGCGGSGGGGSGSSEEAQNSNILISNAKTSVAQGGTLQFEAAGDKSNEIITQKVKWSSSNPSVATISNDNGSAGLVKGVSLGTVTITASLGKLKNTVELKVIAADQYLVSLEITPNNPTVHKGETIQYKALGNYFDGSKVDLTTLVLWTSSDNTKADISNNGLANSYSEGTTTITATLSEVKVSTLLTVTSNPNIPSSIQIVANPAVILNDGKDSTVISATIIPIDPTSGQIPDGTVVNFTIASGSGNLSTTNASSVSGKVTTSVTSSNEGTLSVKASVQDTTINNSISITVASSLSSLFSITTQNLGSYMKFTDNGIETGYQLTSSILNNSGRSFLLTKYELYNGNSILTSTTDPSLLNNGHLVPTESVGIMTSIITGVNQPIVNNGYKAVYYLTDVQTGTNFTASQLFE